MSQRGFSSLKPAISRMATSIGIERVGDGALNELVEYIGQYTSMLCNRIEAYQVYSGLKTVKFNTIKFLMPGITLSEGEGCKSAPATKAEAKALNISSGRQIYRNSSCIFLTRAVMERYIREHLRADRRIAADAITAIIEIVQIRLLAVMEAAGLICIHAKRITLNEGDVIVALETMSKCIESVRGTVDGPQNLLHDSDWYENQK